MQPSANDKEALHQLEKDMYVVQREIQRLNEDKKDQSVTVSDIDRRQVKIIERQEYHREQIQEIKAKMEDPKGVFGGINSVLVSIFGPGGAKSPAFIVTAAVLAFVIGLFLKPEALVSIIRAFVGE